MRRALRSFSPVLTRQLLVPFLFHRSPFFRRQIEQVGGIIF